MKRLLIIPLATLIVGYATSGCSSSSSDKARNDSIAAAELEAARLDSLRQDSIKRRNFTSPDLAFHDLHGDVMKCEYNPDYYFTFDENGNWTNEPQWSDYDIEYYKESNPEKTKHPKVIRDKEGFITRIYNEIGHDYECEDVSWKDGKVKTRFLSTYNYNDNGLVIGREDEEDYGGQVSVTYCNYEIDEMGNWVKRDAVLKITYDYQNTVEYMERETRNITYYVSKGGKTISIPNNGQQKKALEMLKADQQKKEQDKKKGPKWLNGMWVYKGYYNSPLGRIYINVAIDIDWENQTLIEVDGHEIVNHGTYQVYNGAIHIGNTYYEIDEERECIDYGDGLYMRHK